MTKVSSFLIALAGIAMLAGCNGMSYKKTKSGLLYKIISKGNAPQVKTGDILKLHFTQKLKDSLLGSSYDKMPAYVKVDSNMLQPKYDPTEIFPLLHKGDSAVVVLMVDTLMAKMPMGLPPYMKRGDKITLGLKVIDVFSNDSLAKIDSDKETALAQARQEKEAAEKTVSSPKEVEKYIADKKITAQKVGAGTYVEIKSEGNGPAADSGKYVSMRYTGKILATGKQFETNMEAGKEPFGFTLGTHQVIPGWDEGLKGLKKGTKATLYIPGTMAYGPQPGPGGKTYESLIFDVEVVDVADSRPVPAAPQADSATHMHK
ncbi:MAG TPA: FKBP-type peptidyl-prolyl cis-trans isomerase [Chitinophaga sp.]|nr:FKBP-type peptidyl-prolyl cis-trans isomerase [Chitinophaga sp.]